MESEARLISILGRPNYKNSGKKEKSNRKEKGRSLKNDKKALEAHQKTQEMMKTVSEKTGINKKRT